MNPGELNKRVQIIDKNVSRSIWAKQVIKRKLKNNEQNEEAYEFVIRQTADINPYMQLLCEGMYYDIHTVDPFEKGYLKLGCDKAKIHTFYDVCTVKRLGWTDDEETGVTKEGENIIYDNIPCQLVRLAGASATQTEQENQVNLSPFLYLETKYMLKIGDFIEVTHMEDVYKTRVTDFFKLHTYQTVTLNFEGEA